MPVYTSVANRYVLLETLSQNTSSVHICCGIVEDQIIELSVLEVQLTSNRHLCFVEDELLALLTLILRRSRTGTVWFYTSTSNKRAARPKLYTKSLTRELKLMYSRLTLVRISINI